MFKKGENMTMSLPPKGISEKQRGIMWMLGGLLILLYAFNLFAQSLNLLVILAGITMIGYGFIKLHGIEYVKKLFKKF
jgi:hypothetical protein